MELAEILGFGAGLALLVFGADLLVRGASRLAASFGISPLVVGLTVVALGTSAPELAVSVGSAISGDADLALGNAVGSNIANILLILGLSAVVVPLSVKSQLVRFDVPVMIAASVLLVILAADRLLGRLDGLLLVTILVVYLSILVVMSRRENAAERVSAAAARSRRATTTSDDGAGSTPDSDKPDAGSALKNLGLVAVGMVLLVVGSNLLVDAAVSVAARLGVSNLVIGLTLVAAGTSLPEIATSLVAAFKGERDLAVGNVVGSNIFNILTVLGITSLVAPDGIPVASAALEFDLPFMVAVAIACLPIFVTGHRVARWEGAMFLAYYVAFTLYLILRAAEHDALERFSQVLFEFVVPITVVTLAVSLFRALRAGNPEPDAEARSASVTGPARG